MCRNIKRLDNFAPPATDEEIYEAALQYVRKICGSRKPSKANQKAFDKAVKEITTASQKVLGAWVSTTPPRDREQELEKARERTRKRFG